VQDLRVHICKTEAEKQEEKKKAWVDRTVALVAVLSAVIAIVTVLVAHRDLLDALNAQIVATQVDERPIITFSGEQADVDFEKSYDLKALFTVSGKTPARQVSVRRICFSEGVVKGQEPRRYVEPLKEEFGDLNTTTQIQIECTGVMPASTLSVRMRLSVTYSDMFHSKDKQPPFTTSVCYNIDTAVPNNNPKFGVCSDELPVALTF